MYIPTWAAVKEHTAAANGEREMSDASFTLQKMQRMEIMASEEDAGLAMRLCLQRIK